MKKLKDHPATSVIVMILFLVFWYRDVLIFETLSVSHDGVKAYPFFHYLVQNIQHGVFPLWSPTTHSGEPFWTYIQIVGLTNPIFTVVALTTALLKLENLSLLYHWSIFIATGVFNIGLARIANDILTQSKRSQHHWITTPIIFMGSVSTLSWGQVFGLTFTITWFPWIVWFLLKMFKNTSLGNLRAAFSNALKAGLCLAFQLCSFNPAFVGISLAVYVFCFALWVVSRIFQRKRERFGSTLHHTVAVLFFIITTLIFSLPMLKFLQYQNQFFPIARSDSAMYYPQKVTYGNSWIPLSKKYTDDIGTAAFWSDFFTFTGNMGTSKLPLTSEIPIILGPFGLFLTYLSLLRFRNFYYLALAPPTVFLALLSLGAKAKLSILFYNLFPVFSFIRHLEFFLGFVFFGCALLMAVGLVEFEKMAFTFFHRMRLHIPVTVLFTIGVLSSFFSLWINPPPNLQPTPPIMRIRFPYLGDQWSNHRVMKVDLIRPTSFFRDDYVSQAEPLLLYKDSARFYDNATQFIIPAKYWGFLKTKMSSNHQQEFEELLGIRTGKLRIIGPSVHTNFDVIEYNANKLVIDTYSPPGARLFYSQNKVPGWVVRINGQQQPVANASNHPFFDFLLPEGKLRIEFNYRPTDLEVAYAIHYFGQLIFLVLCMVPIFRFVALTSIEFACSMGVVRLGSKRLWA